MRNILKHWIFKNHLLISVVVSASCIIVYFFEFIPVSAELLMSALGSTLAFSYFLLQHSLEEQKYARELFKEFNSRYDALNDDLLDIVSVTQIQLSAAERKVLVDYFNLCAEEWLQFNDGVVPANVWRSWRNGMVYYYSHERIRLFWDSELRSDSYYGFKASLLRT